MDTEDSECNAGCDWFVTALKREVKFFIFHCFCLFSGSKNQKSAADEAGRVGSGGCGQVHTHTHTHTHIDVTGKISANGHKIKQINLSFMKPFYI